MEFESPEALVARVADLDVLVVVGPPEQLRGAQLGALLPAAVRGPAWSSMVEHAAQADEYSGGSTTSWLESGKRLVVAALPTRVSRHNSPVRADALTDLIKGVGGERVGVLVALADAAHASAAAAAVARAFPLYSRKSKAPERHIAVALLAAEAGQAIDLERVRAVADGVRLAVRLVDMPPDDLNTTRFTELALEVASKVGARTQVLRGEALAEAGLGGIYNVGRAATHEPALVILSHEPPDASQTVCWVGKGIIYDTGGLSLKDRANMQGMKQDMGGAAAVLGAFQALASLGAPLRLHAVLCVAENAVGPKSVRPDDIITLYSGKTVEINNTDAEGRLVLSDGVAYCVRHLAPDAIVDLATLTGAQLVATGHRHAGIVCNDDDLEARLLRAGKLSGDLCHALPYVPEFYRQEFASKVADMKNSVKDRMNAQSSCAAQFIAEHLGEYSGPWAHVDLAGPAWRDERGTGFGVALLVELFGQTSERAS